MSKYPVVTRLNAERIADILRSVPVEERLGVEVPDRDLVLERRGGTFDSQLLDAGCRALQAQWDGIRVANPRWSVEFLEIQIAGPLYELIRKLPIDLREDEDFWRYLALFPLRWYLLAREPELQPQDYGGLHGRETSSAGSPEDPDQVIANTAMQYQLIYRTYLIGKAMWDASQPDPFSRRASIKPDGPVTDVWQSHIVRVQIGRIGEVAHSLVDRVSSQPTAEQLKYARDLAKSLTRLKNNISLDVKDKTETDQIVARLP
jgi:hypothetical protein